MNRILLPAPDRCVHLSSIFIYLGFHFFITDLCPALVDVSPEDESFPFILTYLSPSLSIYSSLSSQIKRRCPKRNLWYNGNYCHSLIAFLQSGYYMQSTPKREN
jgi:hypothetical protein